MSWMRTNPLRSSFSRSNSTRSRPTIDSTADFDQKACYDSFIRHWSQALSIIVQRTESQRAPSHDDVLGVVNHLDHVTTLLLVELHHCNKISLPNQPQPPAPCLEHLLSENLLDKLFEWGISTGRYADAVKLEQLKLYELLVSHWSPRHQLLVHEPFLRPLLKLLASCQNEIYPPDVEKRLVILLNQLCVVLMQNVHLLDLFFFSTTQQNQQGHGKTNFIIFSLLIPYVHREGSIGHQARDALLLCMSLSQKNSNIGTYIAQYSSMCPVLVTGLGGLYSLLPNRIEITTIDWHRITPDDVAEMAELTLFMNSLEFCNAVVQVAHTLIRQQLLDFMYQGFLVPVLGPSILQIFKGDNFQTNVESQISAMAYLDLILRSVTEPGLMRIFVKFLLDDDKFDGQRIIDVLVERINSVDSRLCMVTLALFDTLLALNCEDIMLDLILKYLLNGQHVPISHRHKINKIEPYTLAVEGFLDLTPDIMKCSNLISMENESGSGRASDVIAGSPGSAAVSKTIGANWNHYGMNKGDSLYSNYHAYLFDARHKVAQCRQACEQWTSTYRYQKIHTSTNGRKTDKASEKVVQMIKNFLSEFSTDTPTAASGAIVFNTSSVTHSLNARGANNSGDSEREKQPDSLQSIGESSGYESFKYRPEDDEMAPAVAAVASGLSSPAEKDVRTGVWKLSSKSPEPHFDLDMSEDLFAQGTVSLGPFITSIWDKLQTYTSNCLYVNLHLTGLISHLTWFSLPLVHSIFLRHDIATTSDTPSFHQVLRILKQQIDAELPVNEETLEIIDWSRSFLIDREYRLINARKNAIEGKKSALKSPGGVTTMANISAATPMQATPSSSYDPFKRNDVKRRSLTSSISSMFRRPSSGGSQSSHTNSQYKETTNDQLAGITMDSPTSSPLNSLSSINANNSMLGAAATSIGATERMKDLAICAVLLDEWLKELSAISQEQCIIMLDDKVGEVARKS